MPRYAPEVGDIVWLNFTSQAGREQAAHRPALVLSPASYNVQLYNDKTSLLICCPLTTQIKNYPFEVLIAGTPQNAVLADQVKSLDWRARKAVKGFVFRFRRLKQAFPYLHPFTFHQGFFRVHLQIGM